MREIKWIHAVVTKQSMSKKARMAVHSSVLVPTLMRVLIPELPTSFTKFSFQKVMITSNKNEIITN